MLNFILSVLFTVALYMIMRAYPRYRINSFHAIVFNYYSCVLTGLFLTPDLHAFTNVDWSSEGTILTLALGTMFVIAFMFIGLTAQKVSVTAASLAGNMSLVIPVLFGLFIFKNNNKDFTFLNYTGLILALAALALGAIQTQKKDIVKEIIVEKDQPKNFTSLLWLLPLLTFFGSGTNNTLINYLSSKYYAAGQTTVFMIIACTGAVLIGSVLLIYKVLFNNEKIELRSLIGGLILGVPNFLSLYFLLQALSDFGNSAAYVFPIYNILSMLVSSFAAWIIYKEQLNNYNRLGLTLAVVAIILISYQELGL
ncbi:EamA family transporter [Dyadobacter sp. NIV53]|uniref:EamA family transporter n=1 Tax=Dyadobacter sp. NIV53 TaxID=2861765 RepID=UPI001C87F1D1|nr:EamA family transporter [Dyadobacter sp. NIV53]